MKRIKTYGIIAAAILFLVIVFQNSGAADVRFLTWKISMSQALLFPLILALGFGLGFFYATWKRR